MTIKSILDVIKQARLNSLMTRSDPDDIEKMEAVIKHLMKERAGYLQALIEKAIENPVKKTREGFHIETRIRSDLNQMVIKQVATAFADEITKKGFRAGDFECRIIEMPYKQGNTVILIFSVIPAETPATAHQNTQTS